MTSLIITNLTPISKYMLYFVLYQTECRTFMCCFMSGCLHLLATIVRSIHVRLILSTAVQSIEQDYHSGAKSLLSAWYLG